MTKLRMPSVAVVLSIAAVAAAGCGSSSKSKSNAATTPAASVPATPSTTGTTSTGGSITPSTPITSPAVRAKLLAAFGTTPSGAKLTQQKQTQVVDCVLTKYEAQGVKTAGELAQHASAARAIGTQCAKELGIK